MPASRTHRQKHITRKELKRPDEFMTFVESVRDFVLANLNQVLISAGIVAAAAIIAIATYAYERRRDNIAGDQFYSALSALNQKNYQQAKDTFEKLAADEPGREVGRLARFYLGACYYQSGNLEKARDSLVAYMAEAHDPIFMNLALVQLGTIYEQLGDAKKAEGAYSQASIVDGPAQMTAELGVARMLLKQGDRDGAIKSYRRFLETHPYSRDRQTAIEALAQLGAAPNVGAASPPGVRVN